MVSLTGVEQEPIPSPPAPTPSGSEEESPGSYSPGAAVPKQGSAWIHPTPPNPTASFPQTYPATHVDVASRVEDLMRRAGPLAAQGNLSKAMELYNEALGLAPQYAEAYHQRSLAAAPPGRSTRPETHYARFLALDPQARLRVQQEIELFGESGYSQVGETVITPPAVSPVNPAVGACGRRGEQTFPSEPSNPTWTIPCRGTVCAGELPRRLPMGAAAGRPDHAPGPRARDHGADALRPGARIAVRQPRLGWAVSMGPLIDWTTLLSFYDYQRARFNMQFNWPLDEFVRQDPSSADWRFADRIRASDSRSRKRRSANWPSLPFLIRWMSCREPIRARRGGDRAR